ncbi:MAG TPA: hypothetical protein VNI61_11410 [Gemmatimonadales bacterium]|nr:hypothetical protein [Gemmatimonadales bacterium]
MRFALRFAPLLVLLGAPACQESTVVVDPPSAPRNLTYRLEPSGDPSRPAGIILAWDDVPDPDLESYRVYSRGSSSEAFGLRGITTSNTFHDNGVPHLEYYVTAVDRDGEESDRSNVVRIDERTALERPSAIGSISLNRAVHLFWSDNAFQSDPDRFEWYRVYSASYTRADDACEADWALEGATVAPEFLVGAMVNGVSRCFAVSAISREGYESLWSPLWYDTPRPDARNVVVFAYDDSAQASGFRFWEDLNGDRRVQDAELGLVVDGNRADIDFWIFRDPADSSLWFVPEFAGTSMQRYGVAPIADLTSIDVAPTTGYSRNMFEALPQWGYVFQIVEGSITRYGALRVTHLGRRYLIFDWSFQTDPGNPELLVHGGGTVVSLSGGSVSK